MAQSSDTDTNESEVEFDEGDADTPENYICLLCNCNYDNAEGFFGHLYNQHNWDLFADIKKFSDQYLWISFVNWSRSEKPRNWRAFFNLSEDERSKFLQPVLSADDVLMIDIESLVNREGGNLECDSSLPIMSLEQFKDENLFLRAQLAKCRKLLAATIGESQMTNFAYEAHSAVSNSVFSCFAATQMHFSPSSEALKDPVSLNAFRDFILHNGPTAFAGKTVLHLGAGSGLISMLLAKASAKRVFAIESSAEMASCADVTVQRNRFSQTVKIIHGEINPLQQASYCDSPTAVAPPKINELSCGKVDVIFCDWMGYFIFLRSNLPSLWGAMEKFLAVEGRVYPRHAALRLIGAECSPDLIIDFTGASNYNNVDLSASLSPNFRLARVCDASTEVALKRMHILSGAGAVTSTFELDVLTKQPDSVSDAHDFALIINSPTGSDCNFKLNALVFYFDCRMDDAAKYKVEFSTSPCMKSTRFLQTLLLLESPIIVSNGDTVEGTLFIDGFDPTSSDNKLSIRDEFPEIYAEDFDHKTWINQKLKSIDSNENRNTALSGLIVKLQSMLDRANAEVENVFSDVAQSTPRCMREMESVRQQALQLKEHMNKIQADFRKMHIDDNQTVGKLAELDKHRTRTKLAADALREATRWASLVSLHKDLMEGENIDQLSQMLQDMEQSVAYMEHMPDFDARIALVNSAKDRLESLIAPQFMQLLSSTTPVNSVYENPNLDELRRLVSIFIIVRGDDVVLRYYSTWFSECLKYLWKNSGDCNFEVASIKPIRDISTRISRFYTDLLAQIGGQMLLNLFPVCPIVSLLRGATIALSEVSSDLSSILSLHDAADTTSFNEKLHIVSKLLPEIQNFGEKLCVCLQKHLTGFRETVSLTTTLLELTRVLLRPLGCVSDLYTSIATQTYSDRLRDISIFSSKQESSILVKLQQASEASIFVVSELLDRCVQDTRGIGLPSLLSATEIFFEKFEKKIASAFDVAGSTFICEDISIGHNQATGLSSALELVAAVGTHTNRMQELTMHFRKAGQSYFKLSALETDAVCTMSGLVNCMCPFHVLFNPLLAEVQPEPASIALSAMCPELHSLIASPNWNQYCKMASIPSPDADFTLRLQRVSKSMCRAAVTMAVTVTMAPVNNLLAQVPQLPIWFATPGSGEAKLPDLAYLPQEYVTQLGQYIFNLPEQLLPFMELPSLDLLDSPIGEKSRGLIECLRLGCSDSLRIVADATEDIRLRNKSSITEALAQSPSHHSSTLMNDSTVITNWLDWLISGQVSNALIKAVLQIRATFISGDAQSPGALTDHGAKQLDTDLGYFLGLMEELGLPIPPDLLYLRELIVCSRDSFSEVSRGKPSYLVSAVVSLRSL